MVTGVVFLVGAGPGCPSLLTRRGAQILRRADLIVYDALLPKNFLDALHLPLSGQEVIWLGDTTPRWSQEQINEVLVNAACAGRVVARLHVGDALVFGRGQEEVEALVACDIRWEIIPGLSAGISAPTEAECALTHRERSHSVAFATARRAGGAVTEEYPQADTLVIYMGLSVLEEVVSRLARAGWSLKTPVAAISRSSQPWTREVYGTLETLAEQVQSKGLVSPMIIMVGAGAVRITTARQRPTIIYTGLDPTRFRVLGHVLHWPALCLDVDEEGCRQARDLLSKLVDNHFQSVIFTSPFGVEAWFNFIYQSGYDVRLLSGTRVVTAGSGTAHSLLQFGIVADVIAPEPGSPGIMEKMSRISSHPVLIVQGTHAPRALVNSLAALGHSVERMSLHKIAPHPDLGAPLPEHDVIYFASPSGVRVYAQVYGERAFGREVWCMGQATIDELARIGVQGKVVVPDGATDKTSP